MALDRILLLLETRVTFRALLVVLIDLCPPVCQLALQFLDLQQLGLDVPGQLLVLLGEVLKVLRTVVRVL